MLTNPDTIVTCVYKAKYFPRTNFLGARLGHNPSFIWRSIFASQVLVGGGQRWRIGNGNSIAIWDDPWLRAKDNSFISSSRVAGTEHFRVADLMEQNRQGWNWGLIDGMFNERDKGEICKLTITMATEEDKLIWKFNNRGNYTVKSAYRYAMETLIDNEEYRVPGEWEKMWKLRFPQRVKVFLWSAQIAVHIVRTITRMIGTSLLVVKRQSKFGKLLGYGKLFLKLLLQFRILLNVFLVYYADYRHNYVLISP